MFCFLEIEAGRCKAGIRRPAEVVEVEVAVGGCARLRGAAVAGQLGRCDPGGSGTPRDGSRSPLSCVERAAADAGGEPSSAAQRFGVSESISCKKPLLEERKKTGKKKLQGQEKEMVS